VPNSTKNAENSKIQLLTRNAASRDTHESRSLRAFSSGRRQMTSPKLTARMTTMKAVNNHASTGSEPNACTDSTMPDRVRNVPKIVWKNVTMTRTTLQTHSTHAR